jgi:hypothetical protein
LEAGSLFCYRYEVVASRQIPALTARFAAGRDAIMEVAIRIYAHASFGHVVGQGNAVSIYLLDKKLAIMQGDRGR